jgi:hypothetical protein
VTSERDAENLSIVVEAYPHLVEELIKLMPIGPRTEFGSTSCRWCRHALSFGGSNQLADLHDRDCFAVKYLGRPTT